LKNHRISITESDYLLHYSNGETLHNHFLKFGHWELEFSKPLITLIWSLYKQVSNMKTIINILFVSTLLISCRAQKYDDGYKEEMEYYKMHPIVDKVRIPCVNKIYCRPALAKNDENYYDKNVFLIGDLNSSFKYYLCLEQNSTYKIDITTEFVIDTLQYRCPVD
jgi:hypothetical protein